MKQKKKITKGEIKKKEILKRADFKERIDKRLSMKFESAKKGLIYQYSLLVKNATDKVKARYGRKLDRRIAKLERIYKEKKTSQIKKKVYKKEVKIKPPTDAKIKQLAYTAFQLWRKMSLADKDGMVYLADINGVLHYSECVAGHIYSKHNNKHMAFIPENVRPITRETNRVQGTAPGIYWAVNVLDDQKLKRLKELSENKLKKNDILDRKYYQNMYEIYSERLKVEKKRLGLSIC